MSVVSKSSTLSSTDVYLSTRCWPDGGVAATREKIEPVGLGKAIGDEPEEKLNEKYRLCGGVKGTKQLQNNFFCLFRRLMSFFICSAPSVSMPCSTSIFRKGFRATAIPFNFLSSPSGVSCLNCTLGLI